MKKRLLSILPPRERHWVGDGFHVSTLFSVSREDYFHLSPFIMLDHAASKYFPPTEQKRGVGEHPHRGFETVTFAIKGEITHRDSGGGGGTIKAGGVQWMSAASGVVHDEFHSPEFSRTGGEFEMVQLWVNLPAKYKMSPPSYQSIDEADMPVIGLADGKVFARLVAGELAGVTGPAKSYSPITMYLLESKDEAEFELNFADGSNTLILPLDGHLKISDELVEKGSVALFDRSGEKIHAAMQAAGKALVLNGMPIDEPIASYGPFVMNTRDEILQAIQDFQEGKMGQLVSEAE